MKKEGYCFGIGLKRLLRSLRQLPPNFVRWLLVTLVIMGIVAGGAYAYVALTATGEVQVSECLSWVGANTFSIDVYPQESETATLTLANASSFIISVDLLSTITPDPGPKGMTVDMPNKVTVPAEGDYSFEVVVTAGKNAIPETYTVTIDVER